MKKILVLILFISYNVQSRVQPEEGLWDDPDKPGRGVTIELQNGVLVATYFGYDQQGNDQWWQGVAHEGPEGTWSGTMNAFNNGQCIGCDYQFPTLNNDESIGDFSLEFISASKANLTWAGGTEIIQKGNWAFANPPDFLLGLWAFTGFTVTPENDYGRITNTVYFRFDGWVEIEGVDYVYGNFSGYSGETFLALAEHVGNRTLQSNTILPEGEFVSIVYQNDLIGLSYGLYEMIVNENKAEGRMKTYFSNDPDGSIFIRSAGIKFIDKYENEQLHGTANKKDLNNISRNKALKQMAKFLQNRHK